MSRSRFLAAIRRTCSPGATAYGTGTSIVCRQLMEETGSRFPEAHLDAEKMAALAVTGHTVLGFDAVMPLFSVCHEAAAMGCNVNWGGPDAMPESGKPIFQDIDDIRIPADLLRRSGCAVPIEAISLLKNRLGEDAAVCGKVFGSWTQAYHYFGVERFLMGAMDDVDKTRRILDRLVSVTLQFAAAQIEAGADCILLADHATRDLCGPHMYEQFLVPLHRRLAEEIKAPVILHILRQYERPHRHDRPDRPGMFPLGHEDGQPRGGASVGRPAIGVDGRHQQLQAPAGHAGGNCGRCRSRGQGRHRRGRTRMRRSPGHAPGQSEGHRRRSSCLRAPFPALKTSTPGGVRVKICLVGYGAIAEKHMEAFRAMSGVEPLVLVGRRKEPSKEFASRWGFNRHTLEIDEAINDPEVDAVVITSPNELHAEQAIKALSKGKHVLLEIPMALNLEDAEHVTRLSRAMNRRLMIAHTMRFFPAIQEVHRRVKSGELHIHHVVGFFGLMRRSNVTSSGKARSWTDNILWHFGAHMVDVALWTTGHAKADVSCRFGPRHSSQNVVDMSLNMTLPGGELVTLAQSYNIHAFRWKITFIGEEATLDFDMGTLRDHAENVIVPQQSITDLREQNREFVDAVRQDRDPSITGEDVLPAMRILQRAQSCAETLLAKP
jgi:2-hydroxy-4-carboxymuconate semialdehyde hemiacetal dehydrogenase